VLALRYRLLRNGFKQAPGTALFGLLLSIGLAVAAWSGVSWFLHNLSTQLYESFKLVPFGRRLAEATQQVIADRSLAGLLLLLSSANVLSALPNAVAVLYTSEDLPLHLALPQQARRVFMFKVVEVFTSTSLFPALLTLPVLYAFGAFYQAPWIYYPAATLLTFALYGFPVVIGVGLALPLVRFSPVGRAREWSAAVGAVLGGGLIFVLRALRPEELLKTDFANPEQLDQFLQIFRSPTSPILPSALASKALNGLFDGKFLPEFWVLLALSAGLLLLAGVVAGYAYQQGWVRTLEGTVRERGILPMGLADKIGQWGVGWVLWVRDLRLFFRDANQAAQLILVGVLVLLYTTSLQYIPLEGAGALVEKNLKTIVGFMHLAFQGFVIGGVGIRLAFPLYSLEGQGYWMVQTAPVSRLAILLTRFGLALFFLLPVAIALGIYSPRIIGLDPTLAEISLLTAMASAIAAAGLGVGLGSAFPKLDSTNPAEVAVGVGGLFYMGLTLLHSGLLTILAARPVYLLYTRGEANYLSGPEGSIWLFILLITTLVPTVVALIFGYRRMGNTG